MLQLRESRTCPGRLLGKTEGRSGFWQRQPAQKTMWRRKSPKGEEEDGGEANFLSIAGLTEISLSSDSDEEALLDMSRPYGSADVRGAKDEPNVKEDPEAPASSSSAAGPSQTTGQTKPDSSKVEPKEEEMK